LPPIVPNSHIVNYGSPILPIKRVEIFSDEEWEIFIEEWLDTRKSEYPETERLGGSGDKGSDIAAYVTDKNSENYIWDCYQGKHYGHPLMPSEVYIEMGKIIYFSFIKVYPCPRSYFFIAPKNCGSSLSNLLKSPARLKAALEKQWEKDCENKITATTDVPLSGAFLDYFNRFDFSIFKKFVTKDIIAAHASHSNHKIWFGGGLPPRQEMDEAGIPAEAQPNENIYVVQLLKAYTSAAARAFSGAPELTEPYTNHFKRSRISFHYAEQLRNLYRDSLPPGTFEKFQGEIYDGVVNIYEGSHSNGYEKVKAVEVHAASIPITSNPLTDVSVIKDKIGICHQLCNEEKLKWT